MTNAMRSTPQKNTLSSRERASQALELRRELVRVERGLATGESSDERDELLLALQRLDDGTYGICADCARTIPKERLEVMPATRWCVLCAR